MYARLLSSSVPFGRTYRIIPIALAIVFAACLGPAQSARADTIYNYVFSSGAGYSSTGNSDTANLSGTFLWDASTNSIVTSHIDLSGDDATGSPSGLVSCNNCSTGSYGTQYFDVNNGAQQLYVIFGNALSLGASDPLALQCCGPSNNSNSAEWNFGTTFNSVTGYVRPVPEPPSLALFGLGLALLTGLGVTRRKRRS